MAILYLDPSGNGTPFDSAWSGDYTNLDDGDRYTDNPPVTDEMYTSNEDAQATITFTIPSSGTPSSYRLYTWNDQGVPAYELRLSGTGQGNKTSNDGSVNGWYKYNWANSTPFASLSEIAVVITGGSDEDDSVEAMYLEITYTPSTTWPPWGYGTTIMGPSSIIHPPGAGGIR